MRPLLPAKAVYRSMRLCEKLSAIEKMAGSFLYPVTVQNSYDIRKKEIVRMKYTERYRKERKRRKTKKEDPG